MADIIVDPGFGFAKTTVQNYELMKNLQEIAATINAPILVGISRKSMITDALKITSDEALAGTIALNMAALMKGASIIRVHDVREAAHTVKIFMNTNP
ncbi:MAG: dihydropteroate synthase [Duncaniella sp.]|nr:dihydropteroate synthase [Duncaniella sp.]